nr:hypothetical protein [uncultured Psychroserpens sp.]
MDALKLKIFDVLIEKISVSEFENWLYTSEEILSKVNDDSFIYELITINYKSKKWRLEIEELLYENLKKEDLMLMQIKNTCYKLSNSKSYIVSSNILRNFMNYFDYNTDSSIQYEIYGLYCENELVGSGFRSEKEFNDAVKKVANEILELLYNCQDLNEKRELIRQERVIIEVAKSSNFSLKQKIVAFFKKI